MSVMMCVSSRLRQRLWEGFSQASGRAGVQGVCYGDGPVRGRGHGAEKCVFLQAEPAAGGHHSP